VPPASEPAIRAALRAQDRAAREEAADAAAAGGARAAEWDWFQVLTEEAPVFTRRAGVPVPARREVAQAFAEVLEAALGTPHGSAEGDRAWGLVFLFPRLILRPLPSGATGDRRSGVMEVRRVMTRRLQWLRAGRIGELIAEGRAETQIRADRRRRDRGRRTAAYTETELPEQREAARRAGAAARLADRGEYRRARQQLCSTGFLPGGEATRRALRGKCPPRWEERAERRGDHPALDIRAEHLDEALGASMPRHSGTGVDGWRFEHLRDMCGEDPHVRALVTQMLRRMAATTVPSRVQRMMRVCTLLAFRKSAAPRAGEEGEEEGDPDVRPIGIASVLRRLLGRVVLAGVRAEFDRAVAPHQFACGVRSGSDMMAHTMRVLVDLHPEWAWFAWDLANAFNSVSREAVVRALEAEPGLRGLVPLFLMLHDQGGEMLYHDDEGVHTIWSVEGVVQGDPLSMALFCLAIAPALRTIAAVDPAHSAVVTFADDGRVGAPLHVLRQILDVAEAEFRGVGLSLQVRKLVVWVPGADEERLETARELFQGVEEVTRDGMRTVGVPLGVDAYARRALMRAVEGHGEFLQRVREMAQDHGYRHQAMRLAQVCGGRRFQHHIRVATPEHARGPAGVGDEALLRTVAAIIPDVEGRDRPGLPAWRDRMQQPHGGRRCGPWSTVSRAQTARWCIPPCARWRPSYVRRRPAPCHGR
jgi:hypothetical protein